MSFLPDELKLHTFTCPNCKQYISTETEFCKICALAITDEMRNSGVEKEKEEKKEIFLNQHKNTIIIGVFVCVISGSITLLNIIYGFYFETIGVWSSIAAITGFGMMIYGFWEYLKEKSK